ncbi:hypothetical protein [Paramaledivibacter caminithermalis]|jgi:hypothetical protein|uniref:Uncharacterized protein n=1 Tax=Paramaledivibacter caminithermalis (strain DSM 15212 / CIP 107654 / DViRD3) TaxID=1121301 RepID=A0A1M6PWA5_PARC5|nr:hypothetical protein [Paramaledivibacter caminithermalis]SHK12255.1 hypothetical protein SAMN02745912_02329 [Paramaledivibacter caminithermalis DSM 15212]
MTVGRTEHKKHLHNLMKTVEGTGWILCNAIKYMAENNITPYAESNNDRASQLAQNISEIFEVVSECEEPEVIDHIADKMLEYSKNDSQKLLSYLEKYMGDNPLYKRIVENSNSKEMH